MATAYINCAADGSVTITSAQMGAVQGQLRTGVPIDAIGALVPARRPWLTVEAAAAVLKEKLRVDEERGLRDSNAHTSQVSDQMLS